MCQQQPGTLDTCLTPDGQGPLQQMQSKLEQMVQAAARSSTFTSKPEGESSESVSRMLARDRSPWITPRSCMYAIAAASCTACGVRIKSTV